MLLYSSWLLYETESLHAQLIWLVNILKEAERTNEKVHIISHISITSNSCLNAWRKEYRRIVLRYANVITGQFHGHSHLDEFGLFVNNDESPAIAVNAAWVGGSGTSFLAVNSNYRLYYVDSDSFVRIYLFL